LLGRLIGIDVGSKRVGLSRTDLLRTIPNPVGTFSQEESFLQIKKIFDEGAVLGFVIGWPLTTAGEESDAVKMVQNYIIKLEKDFPGVPIYKVDERFTSIQAVDLLVDSGVPKMKRREKGRIDVAAASIILQNFLESNPDL
jgi:putative Holliday junction resolvase